MVPARYPDKRVGHTQGFDFIFVTAYGPGRLDHMLVIGWHAMGLELTCNDFVCLCEPRRVGPSLSKDPPI